MPTALHHAAQALVERTARAGVWGTTADEQELQLLNRDMGNRIPDWYIHLITTVSLCGLSLGWQAYEPDEQGDGVQWLDWSSPWHMRGESLEC